MAYLFQKSRGSIQKYPEISLLSCVPPRDIVVLGRAVNQWPSCGISGHAVFRLLCVFVGVLSHDHRNPNYARPETWQSSTPGFSSAHLRLKAGLAG